MNRPLDAPRAPSEHRLGVVHPTAVIEPGAALHPSASVGAYTIVGPRVRVGPGCTIGPHVVLDGPLELGPDCRVSPFACIGTAPQDRKHLPDDPSATRLGARCQVREYVTINRGTSRGGGLTSLGDDVLVMAYAHVAHDCHVGDRTSLANGTTLAGHVSLGPDVTTGGMVAFHQFVRVGRLAFAAAGAMVERDLPPFCRAFGDRAQLAGLNLVGLRRAGLAQPARARLAAAYRELFRCDRPLDDARRLVSERWPDDPLVAELVAFLSRSARGICR